MSNLTTKDFFSKDGLFSLTVTLENGEILFDAETVAKSLGFIKVELKNGKTYESIRWERVNNYLGNFRPQLGEIKKGDFIPESAVYKLAFKASNEVAEKFQDWLAIDVIPNIRKHGAYMTDETLEKALTDPDFLIKLATQLKETKQELKEKNKFIKQIAISENSLLVREVAKIASKENIKIGEKRLYNKLREWGLVFKKSTEPTQRAIDQGLLESVEGAKETCKGVFTYKTTKVTGKGQIYIIDRLIKETTKGIQPL
ncbi:phage antirepressor KilAC domain-containing protein [Clostridium tetani]|uniref:Phage antirepressor Ant n=3 Tax=Clostridium tetani TaxID=1513 RepID=A0ABY0ELS5_CLOTA|nr:phage antirepressor KilAC domain-containing protein [Clostridium tetani]RXI52641.1 phage antirepressor Ant [Clostridium tetani]RXI65375.1 phage antirepressor Ant [Clostridium tetani]